MELWSPFKNDLLQDVYVTEYVFTKYFILSYLSYNLQHALQNHLVTENISGKMKCRIPIFQIKVE